MVEPACRGLHNRYDKVRQIDERLVNEIDFALFDRVHTGNSPMQFRCTFQEILGHMNGAIQREPAAGPLFQIREQVDDLPGARGKIHWKKRIRAKVPYGQCRNFRSRDHDVRVNLVDGIVYGMPPPRKSGMADESL